jgi:hypothetical protein
MFGLPKMLGLGRPQRLRGGQLILGNEAAAAAQDLLRLDERVRERVEVEHADLLRQGGKFFVRLRSANGAEGIAFANGRL